MITVFHGDSLVMSRKAFLEALETARGENKEVVHLEGKTLSPNKLTLALESKSLFKDDKNIFIENLLSLPKSKEKEKLTKILGDNRSLGIFLWEGRELNRSFLEENHHFKFQIFKLPSIIFKFLENLRPGNTQVLLDFFHQSLERDDPEMVFALLIRQIRLLILAKEGEKYLTGAGWQKSKLINQAKLFTQEQLKIIYKKLLLIDFQKKTSQTPFSLISCLDLLLMEI